MADVSPADVMQALLSPADTISLQQSADILYINPIFCPDLADLHAQHQATYVQAFYPYAAQLLQQSMKPQQMPERGF